MAEGGGGVEGNAQLSSDCRDFSPGVCLKLYSIV